MKNAKIAYLTLASLKKEFTIASTAKLILQCHINWPATSTFVTKKTWKGLSIASGKVALNGLDQKKQGPSTKPHLTNQTCVGPKPKS
jgi:hypothetical protein